jgi:membrane carboxypeptidase/penicillin-binding protein
MLKATRGTELRDFEKPPGIVTRRIDSETGLLANKWTKKPILEYFREGTEPKEETRSIWDPHGRGSNLILEPSGGDIFQ